MCTRKFYRARAQIVRFFLRIVSSVVVIILRDTAIVNLPFFTCARLTFDDFPLQNTAILGHVGYPVTLWSRIDFRTNP